ncbi:isochorismatase family protein [Candidatus Woesearchaeota archaeon]|nr:MAG: isochorismatase family protein [Candidatus Woesearchaeota archaeon]
MYMRDIQDLVFFDIDTQFDFMEPTGKLYVKNSELIRPNLSDLTQHAYLNNIKVIGSIFLYNFWNCCRQGQQKINETYYPRSTTIPVYPMGVTDMAREIIFSDAVYFEKHNFNMFSNINTGFILSNLNKVVVYGLPTEYSIRSTVLKLRKRDINVYVVEDAIIGTNVKSSMSALEDMINAGANIVQTKDVLKKNF